MVNKLAYFLVKMQLQHNTIDTDNFNWNYNMSQIFLQKRTQQYWCIIACFYSVCKFDEKLLFLSCKSWLNCVKLMSNHKQNGEIDSRYVMNNDHITYAKNLRPIITGTMYLAPMTSLIGYYFITNNFASFNRLLNLRQKMTLSTAKAMTLFNNQNCDVSLKMDTFDEILNDQHRRNDYFSSRYTTHQRWKLVRQHLINHKQNGCDDNICNKIAQTLQNKQDVAVLSNMAMFKQCNFYQCNKKNVRLKRCKQCLSSYYCSRLCQKKDWLFHRRVCKQLKSRDYSITWSTLKH